MEQFIPRDRKPEPALAVTCPHAGHQYCGHVAGAVLGATVIPGRVVFLAVNHGFPGAPRYGVYPDGSWETPLGEIPVDETLTAAVLEKCPGAKANADMHETGMFGRAEHSAEVLTPFFKFLNPDVKGVFIGCTAERIENMQAFGQGLAEAIKSAGGDTLIAISMDFSHEDGNPERVEENDNHAIERILKLDETGFFEDVKKYHITTCGRATLPSGLAAAKALGAKGAEVVMRATSADISGSTSGYVVGYAGIRIF
jgi:AmmeMemoRadiSam system protein B